MTNFPDCGLPCKVKAIYSWGGEEDDDLGFIEGDLIEVDSFGDGNWWHGKSKRNKMTGNFPSNFVKIIEESPGPSSGNTSMNSMKRTINNNSSSSLRNEATGLDSSNNTSMISMSHYNPNSNNTSILAMSQYNTSTNTVNRNRGAHPLSSQITDPNTSADASFQSNILPRSISTHSILDDVANTTAGDTTLGDESFNQSMAMSPEEIEYQIQQLKQVQQLKQMQSEMQRKNQVVQSITTPQNLNLFVNQLNDFYVTKSKEAAAQANHAAGIIKSASQKDLSGRPNMTKSYSTLNINKSNDNAPMNPSLPHSMSMPFTRFNGMMSHNNRDFSNTSTLKPSSLATDILPNNFNQYQNDDTYSIASDDSSSNGLPPPPLPPAHRVPIKTTHNEPSHPDLVHYFNATLNLNGNNNNQPLCHPPQINGDLLNPANMSNFYHSNNTSFVAPYDPDTLNQSRSSVHELNYDDNSSISGDNSASQFNSADSVTSSISTAMTDFSATSAGSYFRHKHQQPFVNNNNGKSIHGSLPPIPNHSTPKQLKIEEDEIDDELKHSFMKSKYYRRVSGADQYELENSKGDVTKLNDAVEPDPKEVIDFKNEMLSKTHNPLDVIFVDDKKQKKSTSKFLKKFFSKDITTTNNNSSSNNGQKTNPLNIATGLVPSNANQVNGDAGYILNNSMPVTLKNQNFSDLSVGRTDSEASWIENKVDLNRSMSINAKEYKLRQKRALENEKYLILEPQRLVTSANSNEVVPISKYSPMNEQEEIIDFDKDFKSIDGFIIHLKHLPYISPKTFISNEIAIKYTNPLDRVRACYIFCTEKVHLIESNEIIDTRNNPAKYINNIFQQKSATPYQLAWLMKVFLDELSVPNELIIGCFKKPDDENINLTTNHVWNSVLINNEWRFLDCALGNIHSYYNSCLKNKIESSISNSISSPSSDSNSGSRSLFSNASLTQSSSISGGSRNGNHSRTGSLSKSIYQDNSIYFLTKPLELIHTHIPTLIEQQHISPPLDSMIALSLPSCYPQFFKTDLKIKKFNNALTRLQDLEVFELVLEVPKDVEVFCSIKPNDPNLLTAAPIIKGKNVNRSTATIADNKVDKYSYCCLSQIFWKNNVRHYRIKAVLPNKCSKGFLEIFSGVKGTQKSLANVHPLALTIPLYHNLSNEFRYADSPIRSNSTNKNNKEKNFSIYRDLKFVTRYPTIHCQKHDLYVKEPQIKNLNPDFTYIFKILQHPSMGLSNGSGFHKTKLALQSPTGRIIKLKKNESDSRCGSSHGSWEASVNCDEVGVWKGLVVTDGGVAWCVFAEWYCK